MVFEVRYLIHIGTAGYSYPDWIGPVYPEGIKKGEMLEYYAREFAFTEINSTVSVDEPDLKGLVRPVAAIPGGVCQVPWA